MVTDDNIKRMAEDFTTRRLGNVNVLAMDMGMAKWTTAERGQVQQDFKQERGDAAHCARRLHTPT